MAGKSNIRSMRFSDTMIEMIESQAGDTFTAKFEALVTRCMWELPAKEQELKRIQEQIDRERQRLDRIRTYGAKVENQIQSLDYTLRTLERQINSATANFEQMIAEP